MKFRKTSTKLSMKLKASSWNANETTGKRAAAVFNGLSIVKVLYTEKNRMNEKGKTKITSFIY